LADDGVIGGEPPNAADLQIGATIRVLLPIADLRPLLAGTAAERIALRWLASYQGEVPAGAGRLGGRRRRISITYWGRWCAAIQAGEIWERVKTAEENDYDLPSVSRARNSETSIA
jgi:hypothetical protein